MILSRGRGYIFVHIPKTGGTSMARALEARAMADDILIGDTPKARKRRGRLKGLAARGRLWKHSTLADIDGVVSSEEIAGMFTFALVRNPWDRLGGYYHWLQTQGFDHPAVHLAKELDFAGFLRHPQTSASIGGSPYGSYMRCADGVERVSAWLRLEHLAEDMAPLAEHLGFVPEVPHDNRSDRSTDYRRYYPDDLAEVLGAICAEDIARFGYRFDG